MIDLSAMVTAEQLVNERANNARIVRDAAISATSWLVERHRDEIESATNTTLSSDQYIELQHYRATLRDLPKSEGWPDIELPKLPDWMRVKL